MCFPCATSCPVLVLFRSTLMVAIKPPTLTTCACIQRHHILQFEQSRCPHLVGCKALAHTFHYMHMFIMQRVHTASECTYSRTIAMRPSQTCIAIQDTCTGSCSDVYEATSTHERAALLLARLCQNHVMSVVSLMCMHNDPYLCVYQHILSSLARPQVVHTDVQGHAAPLGHRDKGCGSHHVHERGCTIARSAMKSFVFCVLIL